MRLFLTVLCLLWPAFCGAQVSPPATEQKPAAQVWDALDEVNAARAKRGLKPFVKDAGLTQAASSAAWQRSQRLIRGHLPESDFAYLPKDVHAKAAGCGAWEPQDGWGACCTYEPYTYAGACWAKGRDGLRYMHIFVR
jgi:hypothetical protein